MTLREMLDGYEMPSDINTNGSVKNSVGSVKKSVYFLLVSSPRGQCCQLKSGMVGQTFLFVQIKINGQARMLVLLYFS